MLCELARSEGWTFMTGLKINGKLVEKPSNEVIKQITESSSFFCSYQCPPEKEKQEVREKIGQKFLEWPVQ